MPAATVWPSASFLEATMQQQGNSTPTGAAWMTDFYRMQVESVQDLTSASLEGFERMQQVALQALRQQMDDQLRLLGAVTSRSTEAMVDPQIARPAVDRVFDMQRQLADAVVRTNQRVISAVSPATRNGGEAQLDRRGDPFALMYANALEQWQQMAHRMLDVMQQQAARATEDAQRQAQQAAIQGRGARNEAAAQANPAGEPGSSQRNAGKGERKHEVA
jgi:hypothetical protein